MVCSSSCLVFDLHSHIHSTTRPHTCVGLCCFATEFNSISENFCEHNVPINWLEKSTQLTGKKFTSLGKGKNDYNEFVRNIDWSAVVRAFRTPVGTGGRVRRRIKRNRQLDQEHSGLPAAKFTCQQSNTKGVDSRTRIIPGKRRLMKRL